MAAAKPSATQPLEVLILSPTPTWPLDHGNRLRVHAIATAWKERGHAVTFVHYPAEYDWAENFSDQAFQAMQAQWNRVFHVTPTRPLHHPPLASHHQLDEWWDPVLGTMLDWLFQRHRFDVLIVNYVWLSRAFRHAPKGVLRILDTHDRLGERKALLQQQGLRPDFFYLQPDEEARGLRRADLVWALKQEEAMLFERDLTASPTQVRVVPHVEPARALPRHTRQAGAALKVGLLGARNAINLAATRALLDKLAEVPPAGIRLVIAGRMSPDFADYASDRTTILGPVNNLDDFYSVCDVIAMPVAQSTGQKIRVAETIASGLPIASLSHSFEGYTPCHAFHSLPSLDALVAALVALSGDDALLQQLAEASVTAQTAQHTAFNQALDDAERVAHAARPTTCVVIDKALERHPPLKWQRLLSVLDYLGENGRATCWYDGPISPASPHLLDLLASKASVCLSNAARDALGAAGIASTNWWSASSLQSCIAVSGAGRLWLASGEVIPDQTLPIVIDHHLGDIEESAGPPAGATPLLLRIGSAIDLTGPDGLATDVIATPFFRGVFPDGLWAKAAASPNIWFLGGGLPAGWIDRALTHIAAILPDASVFLSRSALAPETNAAHIQFLPIYRGIRDKPTLMISRPDFVILGTLADRDDLFWNDCVEAAHIPRLIVRPDAAPTPGNPLNHASTATQFAVALDLFLEMLRTGSPDLSSIGLDCIMQRNDGGWAELERRYAMIVGIGCARSHHPSQTPGETGTL